ncbi:MAG: DNA recombination protein RmuC [Bdellovibrionota bacterium]
MIWLVGSLSALVSFWLGASIIKNLTRRKFERELEKERSEKDELKLQVKELQVRYEAEEQLNEERQKIYEETQKKLEDSFRSLSSQALRESNQSFLTLAQTQFEKFQQMAQKDLGSRQDRIHEMVTPIKESLSRVDLKMQEIEQSRVRSEASLLQQMSSLSQTHRELRSETSSLVSALRAPQSRGRWGEMQLKRVVEMAGMLEHCDFLTQVSENTDEGRLRPDLIVRLPGGKKVVVDAKTPLSAFMDAFQATDPEVKIQKLKEHAKHIRKHIDDLSRKSYWSQFEDSPEFVILFLPGEAFFSAALEYDPSLIEAGVSQNVILSTPTTLIALLRAVAYGWQQEKLSENIRQVADIGQELYKRISDMSSHFNRVGKNLQQAVEAYNKTLGTLESRVLVSARKMNEFKMTGELESLESPAGVEQSIRMISAPELQNSND